MGGCRPGAVRWPDDPPRPRCRPSRPICREIVAVCPTQDQWPWVSCCTVGALSRRCLPPGVPFDRVHGADSRGGPCGRCRRGRGRRAAHDRRARDRPRRPARRLGRSERRLSDGGRMQRRAPRLRRRPRDARALLAANPRAGVEGQRRARASSRRAARRPLRPGSRRRRRRGSVGRAGGGRPADLGRRAARADALRGREGLRRRRGHEPDDRGPRRPRFRRRADPAHPRGDHAGRPGTRRPR